MCKTILILLTNLWLLSCNSQSNARLDSCNYKFNEAKKLVYDTPNAFLDSALTLVNQTFLCDSLRKAAVELKITILIAMKKYSFGESFVDSLSESDFSFKYKKNLMLKNFQAFESEAKADTITENLIYRQMMLDLESYLNTHSVSEKEFDEAYMDLFAIKRNILDKKQINKEVGNLEEKYPQKKQFFEYLKTN